MTLKKKVLENIVGKGENADNQAFSPFPIMFSTHPTNNCYLKVTGTFILKFTNAFSLDQSKNLSFGKELICCPLMFSRRTSLRLCLVAISPISGDFVEKLADIKFILCERI